MMETLESSTASAPSIRSFAAKPVVSQSCLPHFPTRYFEFPARSIHTTSIKVLLWAILYNNIL